MADPEVRNRRFTGVMSCSAAQSLPDVADHHMIQCSCGAVIAQCRCPGPKRIEVREHPACQRLTGDKRQAKGYRPEPGEDVEIPQ